jgi:hypothetical protein
MSRQPLRLGGKSEPATGGKTMTEEKKPESDLIEEFQVLSQELTSAVRALWESEDSRKLRQEIGDGFVEIGRQVDTAVKAAQESEAGQQVSEQMKEAVHQARESEFVGTLEQGILSGLRELNEGIARWLDSVQTSAPADEPAADTQTEAQPGPDTDAAD